MSLFINVVEFYSVYPNQSWMLTEDKELNEVLTFRLFYESHFTTFSIDYFFLIGLLNARQ